MQPRINEYQLQKIFSGKVIIENFSKDKDYKSSVFIKYNDGIYLSLTDVTSGDFDNSQWLKIADANDIENKIDIINGIGNIFVSKIKNEVTISTQTYIFEQGASSDKWHINHKLNKFPSVTVVDSAGNEIICEVQYTDLNNCILIMKAPFKGKAYLN